MNILIPTDFSPIAQRAALFALTHKKPFGPNIFFFHAGVEVGIEGALNEFVEKIHRTVNDNEFEFSQIIRKGSFDPETINAIIAEYKIDLVVLGTQGREGVIKSLFGSNTSHVIDNLHCPVLTIPEAFEFRPIKKIGYASDLTMLVKEVGQISPFAKALNASIDIIHIFPVFPQHIDPSLYDKTEALKKLKEEFGYSKFEFHFVKTDKENHTLEGIRQYSASNKPDMLAVFTRERGLFDKLLDPSLTANLSIHTHIPMLSLPVIKI